MANGTTTTYSTFTCISPTSTLTVSYAPNGSRSPYPDVPTLSGTLTNESVQLPLTDVVITLTLSGGGQAERMIPPTVTIAGPVAPRASSHWTLTEAPQTAHFASIGIFRISWDAGGYPCGNAAQGP